MFFQKMNCNYCGKQGHSKPSCPEIVCYDCGQNGHMGAHCPQPNFQRSQICWTCKGTDHKRTDRNRCPGARSLFCSFCFKAGISSEACSCNQVSTRNLQRTRNVLQRLGRKVPTSDEPASEPDVPPPTSKGAIPKEKPSTSETDYKTNFISVVNLSVKIGVQWYAAAVDPEERRSFVNPDRIYIPEYNGVGHFVRPILNILGVEREITLEIDRNARGISLGSDAILAFGIELSVGGRNFTEVSPENSPVIIKTVKRPPCVKGHGLGSYTPFQNPLNLNLAKITDEGVDITEVPMGEFLQKIDDVIDDDESHSSDDGRRKPHPNRRLYRH